MRITNHSKRICVSTRGITQTSLPACGKDAVQQVQAGSGELVWVCQGHLNRALAKSNETGEA